MQTKRFVQEAEQEICAAGGVVPGGGQQARSQSTDERRQKYEGDKGTSDPGGVHESDLAEVHSVQENAAHAHGNRWPQHGRQEEGDCEERRPGELDGGHNESCEQVDWQEHCGCDGAQERGLGVLLHPRGSREPPGDHLEIAGLPLHRRLLWLYSPPIKSRHTASIHLVSRHTASMHLVSTVG